jgi:hypothetical protein
MPGAVIFLDEQKPSWRWQWSEMPSEALARRGVQTARLSYQDALAGVGVAEAWQNADVIAAVIGAASISVMLRRPAQRRARMVLLIPDDTWALPSDALAELGLSPDVLQDVVRLTTESVAAASVLLRWLSPALAGWLR